MSPKQKEVSKANADITQQSSAGLQPGGGGRKMLPGGGRSLCHSVRCWQPGEKKTAVPVGGAKAANVDCCCTTFGNQKSCPEGLARSRIKSTFLEKKVLPELAHRLERPRRTE